MSSKPLVSVIVTTKNEEAHIESCLKSIFSQSYKNIEIIVIDNASNDRTKKIAKKFTKLVFDRGHERSAQRNYGAKKANGEFLLFIDADMTLTKDVVKQCVELLINEENIGAVVVPEKSVGEGYWTKVKAFERSLYEGDASIEAARFFRKTVFREVGGYDEDITGPEDWDLPKRIKNKCRTTRIKSYILHDEGNISLLNLMRKKHYYGIKTSKYIGKYPFYETVTQVVYLLRPAFYKNWKKLYRNPNLTFGMILMLFCEQMAGFSGFLVASFDSKQK